MPSPLDARAPITLFYDGGCPLCRRQVAWVKHRRKQDDVHFIDIRAQGFDPAQWGRTCDELMGRMFALDGEGRWYTGMDSIRALYAVLGYRGRVRLSSLPGLDTMLDRLYLAVAKRRNRISRWIGRE
jgi:predicted DCC family thiol-disulfide oxidoreductase YuxK